MIDEPIACAASDCSKCLRRDRYEGSSADDGEALHSLMIRDATTKNLFLAVNFRPYMIEKHQLDMLLNCSEYSGRKSAYDGDSR
eukprot:m.61373 g.61373  ORF g.61373 m.61373 type:complete len:84 (+) comp15759_c0_seq10:2146-2397(+)